MSKQKNLLLVTFVIQNSSFVISFLSLPLLMAGIRRADDVQNTLPTDDLTVDTTLFD